MFATTPLTIRTISKERPGNASSLTIALREADQSIIGTFNVESPKLNGFSPQDVQFAEIFCRELSSALHTLDLLLVESQATTSQSIDAINREVSLPVDEILTAATSLLDRWIGHEDEMADNDQEESSPMPAPSSKTSCRSAKTRSPGQAAGGPAADNRQGSTCASWSSTTTSASAGRAHSILGRLGCIVETARGWQGSHRPWPGSAL